ncbi:hypothetical protein [Caulobacter sp. X]|nr:hypothetical protein [Caulobacter sp. X]
MLAASDEAVALLAAALDKSDDTGSDALDSALTDAVLDAALGRPKD